VRARHLQLGRDGESVVADHYRRLGYEVLDRNWRTARGEIDLIVRRDGVVVFCEVKTRSSTRHGGGAEAVGAAKQRRIRAAAVAWLALWEGHAADLRFDVAAVDVDHRGFRVELIVSAF
jgi:putative endonuclease